MPALCPGGAETVFSGCLVGSGTVSVITPDQTEAISEVAKLGQDVVQAASGAGGYLVGVIASVPADAIGLLGGDWLRNKRQQNIATLERQTELHLAAIDADRRNDPSPNLLLPLLTAAKDESRSELQSLWSALLANACIDGGRKVRSAFFEVVKQLEPTDAIIFDLTVRRQTWESTVEPHFQEPMQRQQMLRKAFQDMALAAAKSSDDFEIGMQALAKLDCISAYYQNHGPPVLTPFGRSFSEACRVC